MPKYTGPYIDYLPSTPPEYKSTLEERIQKIEDYNKALGVLGQTGTGITTLLVALSSILSQALENKLPSSIVNWVATGIGALSLLTSGTLKMLQSKALQSFQDWLSDKYLSKETIEKLKQIYLGNNIASSSASSARLFSQPSTTPTESSPLVTTAAAPALTTTTV